MSKNISFVVENRLCTGCGTCAGVCPEDAISYRKNDSFGIYEFQVDPQKCTECGLCLKVCPGYVVDLDHKDLFSADNEYDYYLGSYIGCYIGNSTDERIWENASSGGMVTQILISLLQEKEIDGAIVTRMNPDNPLEPEVFIAKSQAEIISASKSKYCPVPLNVILKDVIKQEGRYALVGLPCHIQGIRKAQSEISVLKERISYIVGLFCSRTPSFNASEFLLYKLGIKKEDLISIDYRGRGHPGRLQIITREGKMVNVKHKSRLYWGHNFYRYFWPTRCWLCPDKTSELADISCADNWNTLSKLDFPQATSLIVARSERANLFLEKLERNKKIELYGTERSSIVRSQDLVRKKDIGNRLFWMNKAGRSLPDYKQHFPYSISGLISIVPNLIRVLFTEKKRNYLLWDSFFTLDWIFTAISNKLRMLFYAICNPKLVIQYVKKGYFKRAKK